MDHLHASVLLYALLTVTTCMVTFYGLYRVVSGLYQNFLDFSRRFRGVE